MVRGVRQDAARGRNGFYHGALACGSETGEQAESDAGAMDAEAMDAGAMDAEAMDAGRGGCRGDGRRGRGC